MSKERTTKLLKVVVSEEMFASLGEIAYERDASFSDAIRATMKSGFEIQSVLEKGVTLFTRKDNSSPLVQVIFLGVPHEPCP